MIQREKEGREYLAKRRLLATRMPAGQEECLEFDPALFAAFEEKALVSGMKKDVWLRLALRDGSGWKVKSESSPSLNT